MHITTKTQRTARQKKELKSSGAECVSVCMAVYMSVCMSVCLRVSMSSVHV